MLSEKITVNGKEYETTSHARDRALEWNIDDEDVIIALTSSPEQSTGQAGGWSYSDGRIGVITDPEDERVITVFRVRKRRLADR